MHKHDELKSLGAIVKAARLEKNLTLEQLAERIGIGQRHLIGIENAYNRPGFEVLYRLVRELNIPVEAIFYPDKTPSDPEIDRLVRMIKRGDKRLVQVLTTLAGSLLKEYED